MNISCKSWKPPNWHSRKFYITFPSHSFQSMPGLLKGCVQDVRNLVILLGHWGLHAYGIIAITQLTEGVLHGSLCALVPLPALFYILTSRFTDPSNFDWKACQAKSFTYLLSEKCLVIVKCLVWKRSEIPMALPPPVPWEPSPGLQLHPWLWAVQHWCYKH